MGRPPKDPADLANIEMTVRFTQQEKKELDTLAVRLRASAAEVVRRAVRELYERTKAKK